MADDRRMYVDLSMIEALLPSVMLMSQRVHMFEFALLKRSNAQKKIRRGVWNKFNSDIDDRNIAGGRRET